MNKILKIFSNKNLLNQALTHRSWINEHPGIRMSNERLEFLGDAVLEFIVSRELYKRFPNKEEGYLTALRANLVNTKNLAQVAKKLKIGSHIYLSKGEEESGGRKNPSLLADTIEAVIGALYIDSGIATTKIFIKKHLLSDIPNKLQKPLKDAKSRLQEYIQARGFPPPKYKVLGETGPDHSKEFLVEVYIKGKGYAKSTGRNKSQAEQKAAQATLNKLVKNKQKR
jgi:ribonuclease-3